MICSGIAEFVIINTLGQVAQEGLNLPVHFHRGNLLQAAVSFFSFLIIFVLLQFLQCFVQIGQLNGFAERLEVIFDKSHAEAKSEEICDKSHILSKPRADDYGMVRQDGCRHSGEVLYMLRGNCNLDG